MLVFVPFREDVSATTEGDA